MEIPVPSIATIEACWLWAKRNLELLFKVLGDPKAVIVPIDFNAASSTIQALQFAVFPIIVSIAIELPIYLMTKDTTLGFGGYVVAKLIAYSAFVLVYAFAQRISATILWGRRNLRVCLIVTLYATAFWPIMVLTNYFVIPVNDIVSVSAMSHLDPTKLTERQLIFLAFNFFIGILLAIFFVVRFTAMTAVAHGVGRIRAFLIVLLTIVIGTPVTLLFIEPLSMLFYGHDLL
jgi:hypothetical protein